MKDIKIVVFEFDVSESIPSNCDCACYLAHMKDQ